MPSRRLAAAAIFLGSFLLFGVQPMLGRTLLPSFGGTAAVWTACLAAYQLLLLAGYAYAHGVAKLAPRTQRLLHGGLLVLAVAWTLGFAFLQARIRTLLGASAAPGAELVLAVTVIVGLPYVLLASGSTLLQAWLAREGAGRGVYRLYAVSNLGSLLGLLAYPLLLEPYVAVEHQWYGFAAALGAYALVLAGVGRHSTGVAELRPPERGLPIPETEGRALRDRLPEESVAGELHEPLQSQIPNPKSAIPNLPNPPALPASLIRPWLWWALPALSSFLLVAATNHLTLDITPVPLLWAAILGLFLLSYVVGFSKPGERLLPWWMLAAAGSLAVLAILSVASGDASGPTVFRRTMRWGLPSFFLVLVFLHAWLHAARPEGGRLTRYYLGIAAGGALGGSLAGLGAPALLRTVAEYPAALVLSAGAAGGFVWAWWYPKMAGGLNQVALLACAAVPFLLLQAKAPDGVTLLHRARGFHGTVAVGSMVFDEPDGETKVHILSHGRTRHGVQPQKPGAAQVATTYYGRNGGGVALASHPRYQAGETVRFAGVGLGIGVMAAYGRPGDTYRFYEISPEVVNIATNPAWFTFLPECLATVELAVGDARKLLEQERAAGEPGYDIFMVDAYSGDSIPIHLATDEAFDLYRSRLAPGGILALHVSNWQFDLFPLCRQQMERMGMWAVGLVGYRRQAEWIDSSSWVFFSEEPFEPVVAAQEVRRVDWDLVPVPGRRPPTDSRGNLLTYLKRISPKPNR